MTITKFNVSSNNPYYIDLDSKYNFSLEEVVEIYSKIGELLGNDDEVIIKKAPETRCSSCVYETACRRDRCTYPDTTCKYYKNRIR